MSKEKKEHVGVVHIYSSFNNTIVHVTDLSGSTISRYSGGMVTKQDRLKANPTTGMFLAKKIGEEARDIFEGRLRFLSKNPARSYLKMGISFILDRDY